MRGFLVATWCLFCSAISFGQVQQNPLIPVTWNIKSEELFSFVSELAGEKYQGRLTGSDGYRKSAEWVAAQMAEWGVKPASETGWFQNFPQPYTSVFPGCSLVLSLPVKGKDSVNVSYHYYDEFMPGSSSASGEIRAEVVFAGYGISAPELGYDDYKGVDVKGKIVLMRPEAPVSPSAGPGQFNPWLVYSTHQYKMQNAINHGATGILYHYGPLANTNNEYHQELLVTLVGTRVVEDLFKGTGRVYQGLVDKISADLKPQSFNTGKIVTIKNVTEHHADGKGMNVMGLISGTDPILKDEVIIIGGHLDHCGMNWELCPGANDNASGIAVMMGVAKALATSGIHFKRSILFIGLGAEEQGLVGSGTYVKNPVFPLDKTVGYINLDCVGVGPNLHLGGGLNYPDLGNVIDRANSSYVHRNLTSSKSNNLGRPRTDAAIFIQAGVPSVSISSYGGPGGYHTPADNLSTIWPETLEDLATILTLALGDLAQVSVQ
ncbi:MAG: DUF4910 domain-containing protein [Bacteroidales bacterium]|nr:DUF4910 domain-containing protein [Bacteroidales bacterium]